MKNRTIIKRPIISERSLHDAQKGVYTFEVEKRANKKFISEEISKLFNVKVTAITSEIIKGKVKSAGKKKTKVRLPDKKKVRVRLAKGQTIPLFEVGQTT